MKVPRDHEVQTEELEGGGCTLKDAQTCDKSTNMRCTNNASIACAASTCVHVLQTAGNASRGLVSFPDPQYGTGLH